MAEADQWAEVAEHAGKIAELVRESSSIAVHSSVAGIERLAAGDLSGAIDSLLEHIVGMQEKAGAMQAPVLELLELVNGRMATLRVEVAEQRARLEP